MVRDFVHDPAAYYVYTTLELTQYLRQIRPERFFQHAEMFDHRVTRVHRTVNGIEAPRFRSMKVTTTRVVRDRTQGRGDACYEVSTSPPLALTRSKILLGNPF